MSTLSDITTRSINSGLKPRSSSINKRSSVWQPSQDENSHVVDTDPVKPHFMSSTSASRTRVITTPQPQSRPSTPVFMSSAEPKNSGWMASAGKRFRMTNSKSKKRARVTGKKISPPSPSPTTGSQIKVKSVQSPSPDKARPLPPHPGSPPDKPLPSLPVATIVSSSPVHRRSLIDATEKPLRRSVSPSPGSREVEEWPSLSPSRPSTPNQNIASASNANKTGTSIAGSETDGNKESITPESQVLIDKDQKLHTTPTVKNQFAANTDMRASATSDTIGVSLTNVTSNIDFESRLPQVRQTRTSLMRARLSADGASSTVKENQHGIDSDSLTYQTTLLPLSVPTAQLRKPGPIRSHPNSRYLVTSRGSPYSNSVRSQPKLIEIKKRIENDHERQPQTQSALRIASGISQHSRNSAEVVAVKQTRSVDNPDRRSSIPLPRRLTRDLPDGDSEAEISVIRPDKKDKTNASISCHNSDDGDVDTDFFDDAAQGEIFDSSLLPVEPSTNEKQQKAPDISTTITPDRTDLQLTSDDDSESDVGSLHSFGEFDPFGYRIKRLSGIAAGHGPVLRVSDEADSFIFGPAQKRDISKLSRRENGRSSAPDLRRSLILKEAIRKSKENVKAYLPASLSRQSLGKSGVQLDGQEEREDDVEKGTAQTPTQEIPMAAPAPEFDHWRPCISPQYPCASEISPALNGVSDTPLVAGSTTYNEVDWPLKGSLPKTAELDTVHELSTEEDAWIPPLSKSSQPHDMTENASLSTTPEQPGPPNSPKSKHLEPKTRQPASLANSGLSMTGKRNSANETVSMKPNGSIPIPTSISIHPPRNSSKYQVRTWNTGPRNTSSFSTATGLRSPIKRKPAIPNRFESPLSSPQTPNTATVERKMSTRKPINSFDAIFVDNNVELAASSAKRIATPTPAASSSKSVFSNFRGLFHKRSAESGVLTSNGRVTPSSNRCRGKDRDVVIYSVNDVESSGSRFSHVASPVSGSAEQATPSFMHNRNNNSRGHRGGSKGMRTESPSMTAKNRDGNVEPDEMQKVTSLAFDVLDLAKRETGTARKGVLVDIGKTMVQAVTASREAEKAMEKAKQAAASAEIAALTARQKVLETARLVQGVIGVSGN